MAFITFPLGYYHFLAPRGPHHFISLGQRRFLPLNRPHCIPHGLTPVPPPSWSSLHSPWADAASFSFIALITLMYSPWEIINSFPVMALINIHPEPTLFPSPSMPSLNSYLANAVSFTFMVFIRLLVRDGGQLISSPSAVWLTTRQLAYGGSNQKVVVSYSDTATENCGDIAFTVYARLLLLNSRDTATVHCIVRTAHVSITKRYPQ